MHWADKVIKEIIASGKYRPYWVDDMKTPSGFAHIGSLRGPLIHSVLYRAMSDAGKKARYTFVFNDFDPADEFPPEFKEDLKDYAGFALKMVPSPVADFSNLADLLAEDLKKVMIELGCEAEFISSWDLYKQGKFDEVIHLALDHAEEIQEIYHRVSGSAKKEKGWLPFQAVCEKCKRLGTTRIYAWDGKEVSYKCEPEMVTWARGCGYEGKISPFGGTGKLPWKVDWSAHWKVIGVTIEGAGKDHASAGGSYDITMEICEKVFDYPKPYKLPYEFFLIGGRKMSSSKGLGLKAHDVTKILPAEVARFLFTRTNYKEQIEFDPVGTMAIPDLFDEYDRCWESYNNGSDENLARVFELSQITKVPKKNPRLFIPRFRDIANYLQLPNIDTILKFREEKSSDLSEEEKEILEQRIKYAKIWLKTYAPEDLQMQMTDILPEETKRLSKDQKKYLASLVPFLEKEDDPENLQLMLFNQAKKLNVRSSDAFSAIYLAFIGKEKGPRAAWFLLQYPKERVLKRLGEAASLKTDTSNHKKVEHGNCEGYAVSSDVKAKFPEAFFAYTIIEDVKIKKTDPELEALKKVTAASLKNSLSIEKIGEIKPIQVYRKMFRATGIDYHSRRPSPDALLRRIVQGKNLYTINTAVDAYNLAVVESGIGLGGFDLEKVMPPVVLRFSKEDEAIRLLGDDKPTKTRAGELVYADGEKVLTLDLNYRDIDSTKITEKTKNIILFADGGPDINSEKVKEILKLGVDYIIRFCGGKRGKINLVQ